jgi:hypothetical protein
MGLVVQQQPEEYERIAHCQQEILRLERFLTVAEDGGIKMRPQLVPSLSHWTLSVDLSETPRCLRESCLVGLGPG